MQTAQEMRSRVIYKAMNDDKYREKLLNDPNNAIGEEIGMSIPNSLSIHVHEEKNGEFHLVLPPDSKLSESDLQSASGSLFGDIGAMWRAQDW